MKIQDGKGTGKEVEVDSKNRLRTISTVQPSLAENSLVDEQVYMFSTGSFIPISTTGTETGVFYLKNISTTKNLIINSIRTCGTQVQKVILYKNPTGGTVIDDATAGNSLNLNFTSPNSADATVYIGADTKTLTGGTHVAQHINNIGHSTVQTEDALILGKNDSIGISFELAIAGDVCLVVEGYFA